MLERQALWAAVDRASATVFLVAGGFLLVAGITNGVDVFTPIETQHDVLLQLEGLAGFGGVVLSFVGMLGLYPDLSKEAPRMARVGILLALGPTGFFSFIVVSCTILAPLLGFPSLKTLVPSFVTISGVILLLFSVSLTIFGVASLRTAVPSRGVGCSLLVVAMAWYTFFGVTLLTAPQTPVWMTFLQTMLMAIPLTFIGYRLRTATQGVDHQAHSGVTTT